MKSKTITTKDALALTTFFGSVASVVTSILNYYYVADVMTFTQEFSAFGFGW